MTARPTVRSANGPSGAARDVMLRAFTWANRNVVLPMLRRGWVGSPATGYVLVLTTIGRAPASPSSSKR